VTRICVEERKRARKVLEGVPGREATIFLQRGWIAILTACDVDLDGHKGRDKIGNADVGRGGSRLARHAGAYSLRNSAAQMSSK